MSYRKRCIIAAIIVQVLVMLLAALAGRAGARDLGQWETTDPEISAWYRSLKQPDNPAISCCGEADAYWADRIVIEGGKVYAVVTDDRPDEPLGRLHIAPGTRFEIPPNKMKRDGGNPTGHSVLFVGAGGVYCFVTGTLS